MKRKTHGVVVVVGIMLLFAAALSAQDIQEYPINWDPVEGAGGYRIELQNEQRDVVLAKVVTKDTNDYLFQLKPGNYRFRLTTLNHFMRDEKSTDWMSIAIEVLSPPLISEIKPKVLKTDQVKAIVINGKHFTRQIKAWLIDPAGKTIKLQVRQTSLTNLQIVLPALAQAGYYGLQLSNSGKDSTTEAKALQLVYPQPIFGAIQPNRLQLGATKPSFHIQASNLADCPQVILVYQSGDNQNPILNPLAQRDPTGIQVRFAEDADPGEYEVLVRNRADETPISVGKLSLAQSPDLAVSQTTIVPLPNGAPVNPVKANAPATAIARRALNIGVIWNYCLPIGPWSEIYSGSPVALSLSGDWFFTPHAKAISDGVLDFAAGLNLDLNNFSVSNDSSLVPSSMTSFAVSLHPELNLSWPFLELSLAPGLGLSYASLTSNGSETRSTLDFIFEANLRATIPVSDWLGLGVDLGYKHYFFTQSFDQFALSVCGVFTLSL